MSSSAGRVGAAPSNDLDASIRHLVTMGVSEDRARFALKRSNGNLAAATDFVLTADVDDEMRRAGLTASNAGSGTQGPPACGHQVRMHSVARDTTQVETNCAVTARPNWPDTKLQ